MKACLENFGTSAKFVMSILVMFVSLMLSMFVASTVSYFVFDVSFFSVDQTMLMSDFSFMRFFQSVYSIGLFIIPPLVIAYLCSSSVSDYLHLNSRFSFKHIIISIIMIIAALPAINFMGEINSSMHLPSFMSDIEDWMIRLEENAKLSTERFLLMNSVSDLFVNLIIMALIPALGEELLFRGIIQKLFIKMTNNSHLGIILAAIAFSAFHMQFFGFIPRMVLAILFGYILLWSGSIYLPILAHFANNATAVVISYAVQRNLLAEDVQYLGISADALPLVVASFVLVSACMYYLHLLQSNKL